MKKTTAFDIAKSDITNDLNESPISIFKYRDLSRILYTNKTSWRLPQYLSTKKFIEELLNKTKLAQHDIKFNDKKLTRYSLGDVSIYRLVLSLRKDSYFTHYTAMSFLDLTEQIPKTIYANFEQPPKPKNRSSLTQEAIDRDFKKPARVSHNVADLEPFKVYLLNGMSTNRLGVTDFNPSENETIILTSLERTLIDISVRPQYAGGTYEVQKAFVRAKEKLSVNKLCSYLKKLDYVFPYYQSIGFYLENAGYTESQLNLLEKFEQKFDFYLTHQMQSIGYSKRWKLYYPESLSAIKTT